MKFLTNFSASDRSAYALAVKGCNGLYPEYGLTIVSPAYNFNGHAIADMLGLWCNDDVTPVNFWPMFVAFAPHLNQLREILDVPNQE